MNYRLLLIGIAAGSLVAGTPSIEHAAADDAVPCDNAVGATCKGDFAAPKPPATVDSQIVALKGSGADVLVTAAIPKFAALAIRKVYEVGWKPTHFLTNVSISVKAVMQPAGTDKAVGIISAAFLREPTDPRWRDTPEYKAWLVWKEI
jgi:hypothetical protein